MTPSVFSMNLLEKSQFQDLFSTIQLPKSTVHSFSLFNLRSKVKLCCIKLFRLKMNRPLNIGLI